MDRIRESDWHWKPISPPAEKREDNSLDDRIRSITNSLKNCFIPIEDRPICPSSEDQYTHDRIKRKSEDAENLTKRKKITSPSPQDIEKKPEKRKHTDEDEEIHAKREKIPFRHFPSITAPLPSLVLNACMPSKSSY